MNAPPRAALIADQRGFLLIAAGASVVRMLVPGMAGARATWTLIGALWLAGLLAAVWQSRRGPIRDLVSRVGVQSLGLQLLVALPAVALGTWRLMREAPAPESSAAFLANAAVTVIAVPLLSAAVLTMAGLAIAVPVWRLAGGR